MLELRDATAGDVDFLWLMLTHAASMTTAGEAAIAEAQTDAYLRGYVEGWGRAGDLGVIAVQAGERVGAAWLRIGASVTAAPGEPELATATLPIVLSVREGNPAIRLYERFGFHTERTTTNRVGGTSFVMRLELARLG